MVTSKLVSYISNHYPKIPFVVRSKGCVGLGLPRLVIFDDRDGFKGLSMWISSRITDLRLNQVDRFVRIGHAVLFSNDYDELCHSVDTYLSGKRPSGYVTDNGQLRYIRSGRLRGTDKGPLSPDDINMLYDIAAHATVSYSSSIVLPTFGSKTGPDIVILSGDTAHNGLAIWLSDSRKCYNTSRLSEGQFRHLLGMAKRLYLTITGNDYDDIIEVIDTYVNCNHMGTYLPEFPGEDCIGCY